MPPRLNHLLTPLSLFRSSNPCSSAAAASPFSTTTRNRDVAGRAVRTARASAFAPKSYPLSMQQRRMNSTKEGGPGAEQQGEPGQDQLQSVSEEAADIAKIKAKKAGACGDVGAPEWEHGTPVEDILKRDKDAMKNAPKIMRDEIAARKGTRSYSTSARLSQGHLEPSSFDLTKDGGLPKDDPSVTTVAQMLENATPDEATREELGYKFDVPEQLPRSEHLRFRYDPVVDQFTKLIMKDGKLSLAQRNMNLILDHLRTSPPPKIDSTRPLLPGPPAPQLPLNPILYLTLIIDSVAPLLRIRQQRGAAGGGASLPIPIPLRVRQRRRAALQWIIAASEKRRDTRLAVRLANELVAVAEGRSSVWEHRAAIHKLGVSARTNVNWSPAQRGRKALPANPPTIQSCVSPWSLEHQQAGSLSPSSRKNVSSSSNRHSFRNNSSHINNSPSHSQQDLLPVSLGYPIPSHPQSSFISPPSPCLQPPSSIATTTATTYSQYLPDTTTTAPFTDHSLVPCDYTSLFPSTETSSQSSSPGQDLPWLDFVDFDLYCDNENQLQPVPVQQQTEPNPSVDFANTFSLSDCGVPLMGQDLGFAEDSSFMNTQEFIQSTSLSSIPHYQTSIGRQPPRGLHPSQAGSIFLNPVLSSFTGSPAVSADAHLNNQQLHRPGQQQQQQVNYSPSTASQVQSPESPTTSSSTGDNLASTSAVGRRKRTKPDTDIVVSDPSAEKRRRNTLAARRFRQKQQDRVAQLERALEEVNKERDALKMQVARWEGEAMALRGMLADREKKE